MSHKQTCIGNCMQHLQQRDLTTTYSPAVFNHYYRKNKWHEGNAFLVGLKAADMMIQNFKQTTQDKQHETGNDQ